MVPRYWTMRGYRVERRFGWDTHGLPIEMQVEKQLGISGPKEIAAYGIDRFNEACRALVTTNTETWSRVIRRVGRWVDMEDDYKTMDTSFMESVWWVFRATVGQGVGLSRLQGDALFVGRRHSAFQLRGESRLPGRGRPFGHGEVGSRRFASKLEIGAAAPPRIG